MYNVNAAISWGGQCTSPIVVARDNPVSMRTKVETCPECLLVSFTNYTLNKYGNCVNFMNDFWEVKIMDKQDCLSHFTCG